MGHRPGVGGAAWFDATRAVPRATALVAVAMLALVGPAGCGASALRIATVDDADRAHASPAAQESAALAPDVFARAEQQRALARQALAAGDHVGANLYAETAVAAYAHAITAARRARANAERADAQKALDEAVAAQTALDAARTRLDAQATDLEGRLRIVHERLLPAASGPASADREAARQTAARSLWIEARMLCDAARLVAPDADGLAAADGDLVTLQARVDRPPPPEGAGPIIDDAGRARARCLDVLTRAGRKSVDHVARADALLSELSAAGGWEPARDERGVVVTLRGLYRGAQLTPEATDRLKELGRVAAAHPSFALQVAVHDAVAPAPGDETDARRGNAAMQALIAGGAPASRIQIELAGARAPVADPRDARRRARNERLEVVFVDL